MGDGHFGLTTVMLPGVPRRCHSGRRLTARAWALLDRQLLATGVVWLDEPDRLDDAWRTFSARDDPHHKLWTDDYLAAFAQVAGARLITLDRAMAKRYPSVEVETI